MKEYGKHLSEFFCLALSCLAVYIVIWSFAGGWPWLSNPYNSYVLQAKAWLSGHVDLGRNYEHLELAIYKSKYFVSFPPLPSVLLLPFAVFGISDNFAGVIVSLVSCFFAWRLCKAFSVKEAFFCTAFLMLGTNVLIVETNSWVWFIAQNMSFCLSLAAFLFAKQKKGTASCACLALAILCRPLQIVYFPLIILILSEGGFYIKEMRKWFLLPLILAVACMIYNYVRFDNPLEFGHNYLPEFISAPKGQFDISYIPENAKSLIRLPQFTAGGKLQFPQFDGMSVFLCFPIIIFCILYSIPKITQPTVCVGLITAAIHILLILSHKTMGGYHFGNRYITDVMPCLFYLMLSGFPKNETVHKRIMLPFFLFGLSLNAAGAISMYS